MANKRVPVQEGLFTWPSDQPCLIGSRDKASGRVHFPAARNVGEDSEKVLLSTRGKLYTWTIQNFLPKNPPYTGPETMETFQPYGVGYIELPGEVIVESRLTTANPQELKIGMEMELTIIPFRHDENGDEIVTFAFKPVALKGNQA